MYNEWNTNNEAPHKQKVSSNSSPESVSTAAQFVSTCTCTLCGYFGDGFEEVRAGALVQPHLHGVVVVLVYGGVRLDLLLLLLLLLLVPLLFLALPPGLLVDLLHRSQLLLQLHPPVLEPDLDLALGQTECVGDLDAPPPGQVVIEVELFLQLQRLEPGVGLPAPSPRAPVRTWNTINLTFSRKPFIEQLKN